MFDSMKMFELGLAFLNAGEVNFHERVIERRSDYQNVAGVVNLAFACELFIKCLLNMEGQQSKKHGLNDLWSEYRSICCDTASEIEESVMSQLSSDFTFEDMICNDSNVFTNYRYFFEPEIMEKIRSNQLRLQFLRILAFELSRYLQGKLS